MDGDMTNYEFFYGSPEAAARTNAHSGVPSDDDVEACFAAWLVELSCVEPDAYATDQAKLWERFLGEPSRTLAEQQNMMFDALRKRRERRGGTS